ncbi:RNA-splicing factor [Aspergillus brasiliensis]|uniref:Pre-mRNA-splicing factor CWC24 n=1 Tax=Aspergillus brasiliensis TaxID=319629 RepID=A0A9W5YF42_9EURO|nr:RNA-splicing factor [Aspergillus brasiliensis]GKZ44004.1 RNA-splicing factor [Aspergillus brasiliensis]
MAETTNDAAAAAAEAPQPPVVTFKKRGAKASQNIRKRPAAPPVSQGDDSSDFSSSEDESGHRIKRRKNKGAGVVSASSATTKPVDREPATTATGDGKVQLADTNDATKHVDWFDEDTKDARSSKAQAPSSEPQMPDGTYKGLANQTSFIKKNPNAPNRSFGPIKAATNIRTITVTDYSPDVCKDYKQTGFCGFGDNCKFLHDRSDYKQGWELDREWETVTKGKQLKGTVVASADRTKTENKDDDEEAMLEDIPFACFICKGPYREPIVTKCGHYFCESCALQRYKKDPSCAACGSATNGLFSSAKRLKKLLDRKRDLAAKRRQEAIEAGEEETTTSILTTYPQWVSSHTITTITPLLPDLRALRRPKALGPGTVQVALRRRLVLMALPLLILETLGLVLLVLLALLALLLQVPETPGIAPAVLPVLLLRDQEILGTVLAGLLADLLALLLRLAPETLGTAPVAPQALLPLRVLETPGIALVVLLLLVPPGPGTALGLPVLPVLRLRDPMSTAGGKQTTVWVC